MRSPSSLFLLLLIFASCFVVTDAAFAAADADRRPKPRGRRSAAAAAGTGTGTGTAQTGGRRGGAKRSVAAAGGGGARAGRSQKWHALRTSGVRSKGKSKVPRWEREGDALYHVVSTQQPGASRGGGENADNDAVVVKATNVVEAREVLSRLAPAPPSSLGRVERPASAAAKIPSTAGVEKKQASKGKAKGKKSAPPHMLWGELPVGPILRQSLLGASLPSPTPVQSAAFSVITSRSNAVIASPTGTGKSLAYLVPLLASSKGRGVACGAMIVTPTIELAQQLQREVDKLWPPSKDEEGILQSAMHVVGNLDRDEAEEEEIDGNEVPPKLLPQVGKSPLLAGTPRSLRALLAEARSVSRVANPEDGVKAVASDLRSNLRAIVLDEADRLLRTEGVARDVAEAKQRRESNDRPPPRKKKRPQTRSKTRTEFLLKELPVPLERVQIICASATVGRTLRRQLMDLLQTPSLDKTAVLVTAEGDVRTGKDVTRRKSSLVPDTLRHLYSLLPDREKRSDDNGLGATLAALQDTMRLLDPPAPTLVFPGRLGVDCVEKDLMESGMNEVRTLKDINLCTEDSFTNGDWEQTPIYVVGDKFGRGLDVPGIRYVVLLSPPSSAAGYTHLAGRTGRNGQEGTAITLTRPREAHKVVAIAEALGLSFEELGGGDKTAEGNETMQEVAVESSKEYPWALLPEAALKRKTVAELTEYLAKYRISLSDPSGKRILKADIISAIHELHQTSGAEQL